MPAVMVPVVFYAIMPVVLCAMPIVVTHDDPGGNLVSVD
jgi:hypothetical protein